jgi:hypothetical protein
MNQTLHIFAKDTRRFLPEILVLAALLIGQLGIHTYLCATGALNIFSNSDGSMRFIALIFFLLTVLIPVGWWLLITRVVQEERLVGDTQFWITRPYQWKSLLTAKLLFLAAFVDLMFLVVQCSLLVEEGFSPLAEMPKLLLNLLLITCLYLLPLISIAAITSSFARMTLTLLGALLAFGVAVAVASFLYGDNRLSTPIGNRILFALAMAICIAVVVIQYARRKVWLSRILLISFPVLICVIAWIAPDQRLMNRIYPVAAASVAASVHLSESLDTDGAPTPAALTGNMTQNGKDYLVIGLPFQLPALAPREGIVMAGVRATVEAPDGFRWSSPWQQLSDTYLPGATKSAVNFNIPVAIYEKYKSMPVTLHLDLAYSRIQAGSSTTVPFSREKFSVPGFGICSLRADHGVLNCFAAVHQPPLTLISANVTGYQHNGNGHVGWGSYWAGSLESDFSGATVLPYSNFDVSSFRGAESAGGSLMRLPLGTPLTFTQYKRIGRAQSSLTLTNFHLPTQQQPQQQQQ